MHYRFFIGIDISKQHLDLALLEGGQIKAGLRVENHAKAIAGALLQFTTTHRVVLAESVCCMEHTGIYSAHLLSVLGQESLAIWLEHPLQIKYSLGLQRGKNDQIDARRIAQYAYKHRDSVRLWTPARPLITQLQRLTTLRDRLIASKNSLEVSLSEEKQFTDQVTYQLLAKHSRRSLEALQKDLKAVEKQIQTLIDSDEQLTQLFAQLTSLPGIGPVTARELMITTNEFKDFPSAKKLACYAGVAPFEHSSGKSVRGKTRISHQANKRLKTLLHLAAMRTVRLQNKFSDYYQRKVKEGKNKMSALNAVPNKLLHTLFALVKQGKKYDENYAL